MYQALLNGLSKVPARYNYPEIVHKTFVIPGGQNQCIKENVFNNDPIRRLVVAMNTNDAFAGTLGTNPYHYQKFDLREIRVFRGNVPVVSHNTEIDVFTYSNTVENLNIKSDGNGIPVDHYKDHFIMVFDLTPTREADSDVYFPDLVGEPLRIELYFTEALTNAIEVVFLGEKLTSVLINKEGKVEKNG